jgi:hypothetical protein
MAVAWWRRPAPAKSGTACVLFLMSAASAAWARPTLQAGAPETPASECHFCVSGAGTASRANGAGMPARPSATAWTPSATYWASSRSRRPWLTFAAPDHHRRDRHSRSRKRRPARLRGGHAHIGATTSCSWSENTALAPNASPAARRSWAVRAERPGLAGRQHALCRNAGGAGPAPLRPTPVIPSPRSIQSLSHRRRPIRPLPRPASLSCSRRWARLRDSGARTTRWPAWSHREQAPGVFPADLHRVVV